MDHNLLENRLQNDLINNKEYTVKKNIFNKINKTTYRYVLVPIHILSLFYYTEFIILRRIAVQKKKKTIQNRNSNRAQYQINTQIYKIRIASYKLIHINTKFILEIKRNIKINIQKNIGKYVFIKL